MPCRHVHSDPSQPLPPPQALLHLWVMVVLVTYSPEVHLDPPTHPLTHAPKR